MGGLTTMEEMGRWKLMVMMCNIYSWCNRRCKWEWIRVDEGCDENQIK